MIGLKILGSESAVAWSGLYNRNVPYQWSRGISQYLIFFEWKAPETNRQNDSCARDIPFCNSASRWFRSWAATEEMILLNLSEMSRFNNALVVGNLLNCETVAIRYICCRSNAVSV